MEEIPNFTQEDMLDDDVMILDIGTTVYLWIGSGCNAEEKTKAMETAQVNKHYSPPPPPLACHVSLLSRGHVLTA